MNKQRQVEPERVYRLWEAPEHPLAKQYGITERQFRRWVQAGRISYVRPGGLVVLLTDDDIRAAILGTRFDAVAPVEEVEPAPPVTAARQTRVVRRRKRSINTDR